jgi:DNA repair exonuclease SbcCD nuclease subunit
MKILHIADTHLGYSAYRKTTPDGINQREMDTYNSFSQVVEYALKSKPDLILHCGDLFDSVRPNNRAITFALNQLISISKAKIPFIVIAGNHEHPKLKETCHIFSIFDHIENIYPFYKSRYEKITIEIKNKAVTIHTLPQCDTKRQFEIELEKIAQDKDSDYNIFVSHGAVTGIRIFSMNEFNEQLIPAKMLSKYFDYIALGHFHRYSQLTNNAFYSGSTERFTFIDAPDKKGIIEIELLKNSLKTRFVGLQIRKMVDLKPIKCTNLKTEEIMKKIKEKLIDINPKEKTYRITLEDIPNHKFRALDFNNIREMSKNATHYEIKANLIKNEPSKDTSHTKIDALTNEFKEFLNDQDIENKDTILELGIDYIEKIQAREENK